MHPYSDVDAVVAAVLIMVYATIDVPATLMAAKAEKVKRPTVSSAGTSEDISSRGDYIEAMRVTGADRMVQLLE